MGELTKLAVEAFADQLYKKPTGKSFSVQVNPNQIELKKGLKMEEANPINVQQQSTGYLSHIAETLSFEILIDATGAVPGARDIQQEIRRIEEVIYLINGEIHQPNFLVVSWGTFVFKGMLASLRYQYTLFAPDGNPLRVKVSFSFTAVTDPKEAAKKAGLESPDLSRVVELKSGETIASWCQEIYGDMSYSTDVAAVNGLPGIRHVEPGTSVLFPPLVR